MIFNQALLDDLLSGEKSVCFFVFLKRCFWVVDERYNFCLDAEKDYHAYLDKGHITQEQFVLACKEFRGGVLKLTADNFPQYLKFVADRVFSSEALASLIVGDDSSEVVELLEKVEMYYLSGEKLSASDFKAASALSALLPKFYINFDRKIYMHMDVGRFHEELSYPDWVSECADFNFLVPDKEKYWFLGGDDYWKLRFL